MWTNWIISRELQNDLTASPAVLLMSSTLINAAPAFSYGLIDISLVPFLFMILMACPIEVKGGAAAGTSLGFSSWIYSQLQCG